ncbi:MAG: ABC-F family ATP-binding cassette domain-containing protein [Bradymonadales bacterium]|nr:ABC-F family ATP-binding cassette domain-containing protein [Bradymonadales bacterium]
MLQLERISKAHATQVILDGVSLFINPDDRIGLTGPNGTGKTTLIRIMADQEKADSGNVAKSRDLSIGMLPQEIVPGNNRAIMEEILTDFPTYKRYKDLIDLGVAGGHHEELLKLQEELELFHGFDLEARASEVLAGLGFDEAHLSKRIDELSGGYRMRVFLAKLLLKDYDLLLLDEPTNHLDMQSILWLEQYLGRFRGAVVIITHDRYFLNHFATRIAHLERARLSIVKGNYDDFLAQMEAEEDYLRREHEKQQKEIKHLQSYIDKYIGQPKRSKMVSSRKKMLERIEEVKLPPPPEKPIRISMPPIKPSGKDVITISGMSKAYPATRIYDKVSLNVYRQEKIALVGPNGSGKTTLLKIMAREIEPDEGEVIYGSNVSMFYYTQHQLEKLDPQKTVFQEAFTSSGSNPVQTIRNILGAFKFSGDLADKIVGTLSGGERARVSLCKMILSLPNLLLLDEPTNHLDMASREVLVDALQQFDGTIVFISHDRYFIDRVATKVIEVYQGRLMEYVGNFSDYLPRSRFLGARARSADRMAPRTRPGEGSRGRDEASRRRDKERERKRMEAEDRNRRYRETKDFRDKVSVLESRIARLEDEKIQVYAELSRPETYENRTRFLERTNRVKAVEHELSRLYKDWELTTARIEEIMGEEA